MANLCRAALAVLALAAAPTALAATQNGDSFCSDAVCCTAVKANGLVTYTLSRPEAAIAAEDGFGWISLGFGQRMANSPMVIAWPYQNSMLMSQRQASSRVMPTVVDNPTIQATFVGDGSAINGSHTRFSFSVSDNSAPGPVDVIWAYGSTNPASADPGVRIRQHTSAGTATLDLSKQIDVADPVTTIVSTATGSGGATTAIIRTGRPASTGTSMLPTASPTRAVTSDGASTSAGDWTSSQKVIVAHAIFGGIGMMVVLPLGVLVGRLARTYLRWWVRLHYILQAFVGGAFILIAFALGVSATDAGGRHFFSTHRQIGLSIFILAVLQIALGTLIHVLPRRTASGGRAMQNWAHALIGLAMLGLGYAAVWTGFGEFDIWSGLGPVSRGWKAGWGVLLGVFVVAYLLGLLLLKRQDRELASQQPTAGRSAHGSPKMISEPLPGSGPFRRDSSQPLDDYDRPLTAARTPSESENVGHIRTPSEGHEMSERGRWEGGRAI